MCGCGGESRSKLLKCLHQYLGCQEPSAPSSPRSLRESGSKGGKTLHPQETRGWGVTGLASTTAREAAMPAGNAAHPTAASSQTVPQGLDRLGLQIPTEPQSPSPFDGFGLGFFLIFPLIFVLVLHVHHGHPATSPVMASSPTESSEPGRFPQGFLVPLHPGDARGTRREVRSRAQGRVGSAQGRKTGAWALSGVSSCLHHPSLFLRFGRPRVRPRFWHLLRGMEGAGAKPVRWEWKQSLPRSRCWGARPPPPRGAASPALQLHLSRMRKYWICFLEEKKKKKKSNILSAIPDSTPRLWQENAVNLPFPHQPGKKDRFSFNILIFSPGSSPIILQAALQISLLTRA